jgi:hypothetical protein
MGWVERADGDAVMLVTALNPGMIKGFKATAFKIVSQIIFNRVTPYFIKLNLSKILIFNKSILEINSLPFKIFPVHSKNNYTIRLP